VAGIVNNRPAGRSLSDVHGAGLSSPPASGVHRRPWRPFSQTDFSRRTGISKGEMDRAQEALMSEMMVGLDPDSHLGARDRR